MTDLSPPRSTPPLGARRPTPAAGLARQLAAARERVWVARPEAERAFAALLSGEGPPALFFAGDLYHRTQDTASARITLQATLGRHA